MEVDSITPESFLDALGMTESGPIAFCKYHSILTVRQLALTEIEGYGDSDLDITMLKNYIYRARQIVSDHQCEPMPKKLKQSEEDIVWAYTYISPAEYKQLERDNVLKSPYVLFQEYLDCSLEFRVAHPWKGVYYAHAQEAEDWIYSHGTGEQNSPISDTDVFSYLIWRGAQSVVGSCDLSAGPRAIPFFFSWLTGELHGSVQEIDRLTAVELNNPFLYDRYAHAVAINLTLLCKKYDAKLYKMHAYTDEKAEIYNWQHLELYEIKNIADYPHFFDRFNPGERLTQSIPHGCFVTPTGLLPKECLKIYAQQAIERRPMLY